MGVRRGALAAALAALLLPATALADKVIQADPSNRYSTPEVTIDQGERLTFRNNDVASHDVTATTKGGDGRPLFRTPVIERGESAFVEGSQYLTSGHYPFICSVHPSMKGSLHVTTSGAPVPRPGSGGAGGGTSTDTKDPKLGVRVLSRRVDRVRDEGALLARISLDEGARVSLRAVARPRPGGRLVTVARGSVRTTAAGVRKARLRLTRAGRAAFRRDRPLAVVVTGRAVDPAGNRARATHGRTLAG